MGSKIEPNNWFLRANSGLQKVSKEDCYLDQPYLIRTFTLGKRLGGRKSGVRELSGCLEEGVCVRIVPPKTAVA